MGAPKASEPSPEQFVLRRKITERQKEERKYAQITVKIDQYNKLMELGKQTGYSIREITQMALDAYLRRVTVE